MACDGAEGRTNATRSAPFRIGFDEDYALKGVDTEVQRALRETLRVMASLGATIVPMHFPSVEAVIADWRGALAVKAAVAHEATFPSQRDDYAKLFGQVRARILSIDPPLPDPAGDFRDAVANQAVLDAARRSAAQGQWIQVEYA